MDPTTWILVKFFQICFFNFFDKIGLKLVGLPIKKLSKNENPLYSIVLNLFKVNIE